MNSDELKTRRRKATEKEILRVFVFLYCIFAGKTCL